MRIHFAGADRAPKYNALLYKANVQNRLESYYSLRGKPPITEGFERYLLDSGGFAARTRNIIISVEEYAKYINKHKIVYAFNLDTNSVVETLRNQDYLIKHCPDTYIIPIYHMSDWIVGNGLLEKFLTAGFPYIALGGVAGGAKGASQQHKFYASVFAKTRNKVKVHGLGITTRQMLERYPFYSVDSTSWLSSARYGNSISTDKLMTKVRSKKNHYLDNTQEEIYRWLEVQKYINELWAKRGIVWKD